MDVTNPVLIPQPMYRALHSSELGSQSDESVAVISSENHIDREATQDPESSKPPEGVLEAHDIVPSWEVASTPGLSLKRNHDKGSDSPLLERDKSLPPAKRSRQLDGNDLKARLEALVSENQRLATPIEGLPVGSEYGAQQNTDGPIADEVALVGVNEAGGYDSDNSAGNSGFTEKSGYMSGSGGAESADSNSDLDFSELEGVLSIENFSKELGQLECYVDNGISLESLNQQRSKLKKDMADYIDIKKVDIREVKENIEALKQLYVDEADLFAKVQVLEPKVLVQKRCRYNNETFGTHELTLSELFKFVNGSAVFDDILSIVGKIEFGLSNNHVSASHLFIWESMAMGSRLLFGLQINLNDGSTPPVVVSVPLDAQVSDMSRLRKKLVSEVDACIAVKCWQKINPDYPVNIELDLDFKSPMASKLKLELVGKDRSGTFCISRDGVVDELFDIKSGKIYCEKWFQLLNGFRTAYDGMIFSGAADPVRPYNGLPSQTIFSLILEK